MKNPLSSATPSVPEQEMTLVGHLSELRSRLIKSVLAIVAGAIIVYMFNGPILDFLNEPYCELRAEDDEACQLLLTSPLSGFSTVLSVSGYGGLILAMPVIMYQMARFVLPGLYPSEKKVLLPFGAASVLLLIMGIVAGYLLLPQTLRVLGSFGPAEFVELFTPNEYYSFLVKMLLAFGLAAELPVVLIFLQLVGVLSPETMRKNRRIAVVAVVILAAFITPTGDPFTLLILAVPMYLFYEIAVIVGIRLTRNRTLPSRF